MTYHPKKKHLSFDALKDNLIKYFAKASDSRQQSKVNHSLSDSLMSGFACMYFQDPSLLAFQQRLEDSCQNNNLRTIFGVSTIPKETQMRQMIDNVNSSVFLGIFDDFFKRLQRAKELTKFSVIKLKEQNETLFYVPLDATGYYQSTRIHCDKCLTKTHTKTGVIQYSHQALQASIMHPNYSQVIPLMPEEIRNEDGQTKQDCEINAAKRLIPKLRQSHPKLGIILGGDGLYSDQPMIELALKHKMHFLFVAKSGDHPYMTQWLDAYKRLHTQRAKDYKGRSHIYEWMNEVPLSGRTDSIQVNYLRYRIISTDSHGRVKQHYFNSWVSDIKITPNNVMILAKTGRCRWKLENEYFNTLKNQGYCLEHSYGHGKDNLCFNFYLLTLLAFFFHQIFELTCQAYRHYRKKTGSKREMWNNLRATVKIIVFQSWYHLLDFLLNPRRYLPEELALPP